MNKVLILGTGNAQVDIIEKCKDLGWEVYACSNRHGDRGEALADHFFLANIIDVDAVSQLVKDNGIDIVYSAGSDVAMPTVTSVSADLKLPVFISAQTARLCNTKQLLREYLGPDFKGNIKYEVVDSPDHQVGLEFPLILKPVDSQGQRGVHRIDSQAEFEQFIGDALSHSKSGNAIVEEFIDGPEISVNTFSADGKVLFALISDREVWEDLPGGIIHKHHIPSVFDQGETKEKILDMVSRALDKLEIKNGPAYFQIKMKNSQEPVLIEVTPRLDGCHMWKLIKEATGVDLMDSTMKLLMNGAVDPAELEYDPAALKKVSTEFFCQAPGTAFKKADHPVEPDGFELCYYYDDGDEVRRMNGYMEKCGDQMYHLED